METKTQVTPFEIDMQCDKCKEGYMRPIQTNISDLVYRSKPTYRHICNKCEHGEIFEVQYPYIVYEKIICTITSTFNT